MSSTPRQGFFIMTISGFRKIYWESLPILFAICLSMLVLSGCGGGGGERPLEGNSGDILEETTDDQWKQMAVARIHAGGLLSPWVRAAWDGNHRVHVVFFTDSNDPAYRYRIHYLVWDSRDFPYRTGDAFESVMERESVINIDNCMALSFALDQDNCPVVAYRGGTIRKCGAEQQSDAMLSIREDSDWEEYTGAIGEVERNPFFGDGLAGTEVSVIPDSEGNIHLCYQFFYEGCDAMNYQYPDLCYVKKMRSHLDHDVIEETVEGNRYGSVNIQNHVGDHSVIALDNEENPVIFYDADFLDGDKGLRVARRVNGMWEKEWIERGCEVGAISCARSDRSGYLGVAYYVEKYIDGRDDVHCLKYAEISLPSWEVGDAEDKSSWDVRMVDDSTWCGNYCSLAFDSSGLPAIAYYELRSHSGHMLNNLKMARFDGGSWHKETVASQGDIGLYNSLHLDPADRIFICSFSNSEKEIDVFYQ